MSRVTRIVGYRKAHRAPMAGALMLSKRNELTVTMETKQQRHLVTYPPGLAGLPADVRAVAFEFWQGLAPTDERAACPACGAAGLEVRAALGWSVHYVAHCDDVRKL